MGNLTLKRRSRSQSPSCLPKGVATICLSKTQSKYCYSGSLEKAALPKRSTDRVDERFSRSSAASITRNPSINRSRTRSSLHETPPKRRTTMTENSSASLKSFRASSSSAVNEKPQIPHLLNQRQRILIAKSWHQCSYSYKLGHTKENIGVKIFTKLFQKSPNYKTAFGFEAKTTNDQLLSNGKFVSQVKVFTNSLENSVQHLDSLTQTVRPILLAVGASHSKLVPFGFKTSHWDALGEAMLECIVEAQGAHKQRDAAVAWRLFVSWFIDVMKEGFQDAAKKSRRATLPVGNAGQDFSRIATAAASSSFSETKCTRASITEKLV